ncbi:MAG TPA: hypothetical protein VED63_03260 [Acidimicrobiales bacterium]|nr:hypothetical protein [Acidimicrobiales bacterium]
MALPLADLTELEDPLPFEPEVEDPLEPVVLVVVLEPGMVVPDPEALPDPVVVVVVVAESEFAVVLLESLVAAVPGISWAVTNPKTATSKVAPAAIPRLKSRDRARPVRRRCWRRDVDAGLAPLWTWGTLVMGNRSTWRLGSGRRAR